jgi:hypothetical protein
MSAPQIDWEKGSYIAIVAGAIWAMVSWPFKTFYTKKVTDETFLRKHTGIGTAGAEIKGADEVYAPIAVVEEMKVMLKTSIEKHEETMQENHKWQAIAKDWVEHP